MMVKWDGVGDDDDDDVERTKMILNDLIFFKKIIMSVIFK